MGKYLRISSYIRKPFLYLTLQLLHSEFSYEENLIFFFISVLSRTTVYSMLWNRAHVFSSFINFFSSKKIRLRDAGTPPPPPATHLTFSPLEFSLLISFCFHCCHRVFDLKLDPVSKKFSPGFLLGRSSGSGHYLFFINKCVQNEQSEAKKR